MKPPAHVDAARLGAALLALRKRAPKAPLSTLYDRHAARLLDAAREPRAQEGGS